MAKILTKRSVQPAEEVKQPTAPKPSTLLKEQALKFLLDNVPKKQVVPQGNTVVVYTEDGMTTLTLAPVTIEGKRYRMALHTPSGLFPELTPSPILFYRELDVAEQVEEEGGDE